MRARLIALGSTFVSAVAAGALYARYRRDMRQIDEALEASSRIARTARGRVEYARHGNGRPVLVIHGAGGGFDQGLALGADLFGDGFDIIAPSRFGYLATPVPADGSPAAQADAHAALLDSIGIDRAIVVGASAGAPSAIEMALRHPDRVDALILAVPRAYAPGSELSRRPFESRRVFDAVRRGRDFPFWLACRIARSSVVHFLGVPPQLEAQAPDEERARVTAIMRSILPLSRRLDGLDNDSATTIGAWPLERIVAPTLVISAVDDLYGTLPCARFTASGVSNGALMVLESGGHLMVGRTGEVRARVAAFLDGIARARPAVAA